MGENAIGKEQLVSFVLGELDQDEAAAIAVHLASSAPAAEYVAKLREVLETMRSDDSEAPTAAAVRAGMAAFTQQAHSMPLAWLEQAQRYVLRLVYDTRAQPALAGFRGGDAGYQFAYGGEHGRVDLRVTPAEQGQLGRWSVRGQVTTPEGVNIGSVALVTGGTSSTVGISVPDQHGQFRFDAEAGKYDVAVELDTGALIAPGLEIG
ncbi:MAG: hypothetical protein JSV91_01035 [Phycisphaerales bacterium]|nr:MAG: hypothetical protein JSV91_01035 [Phycisphaerales bacterium]